MLIFRYFRRELLNSLLTVTLIILVIFIGNQLIRYLSDAAAGNMAIAVVGRLLLLEVPYLLALLLPLTFFIACLLTLGRLSADHELIVLEACGLSRWQQWLMVMQPCLILTLIIAFLSLWLQPKIALYRDQLLATTNAGASIQTLVPGKFQASGNGHFVFYVEQSSVDHKHLNNIFIAEKQAGPKNDYADDTQWNVIKATKGELVENLKTRAQYILIDNGLRYTGLIGTPNYQVMNFKSYAALARNPSLADISDQMDALSTSAIIKLARVNALAQGELEWRLSLPLAALLLGSLALTLGVVAPRQGRYAKILPGVLLLVVYANMMFVTRAWVSHQKISALPGMGWIHLAMAALVVYCYLPATIIQKIRRKKA